jgi:segregation and condensation protein B
LKASQIVEAVLFASDAPLKAEEIARADESLDEDSVEQAIRELQSDYAESERAYQVVELAEGYQILTLPEFSPYLERFDTVPRPSRLSGPALETLAIIAYRQPIGRLEVEYIRGVSSAGVIRTLQDRGIIDIVGRAEGLGRPLLYGTTTRFLEHFGFRSLSDLPTPEELPVVLRERTPLGIEEGAPTEGDVELQEQVVMPLRGEAGDEAGEASDADDEAVAHGTNGAVAGLVGTAAPARGVADEDDAPRDPFYEEPEDA